jgi:hypothetical protein
MNNMCCYGFDSAGVGTPQICVVVDQDSRFQRIAVGSTVSKNVVAVFGNFSLTVIPAHVRASSSKVSSSRRPILAVLDISISSS